MKTTRVYGASDDLVEIEGEVSEEFGAFGREKDNPKRVAFSDGTVLHAYYPKRPGLAVWAIEVVIKGSLFDRIDACESEDSDPYSDVAHFREGITAACEHTSLRTDRVMCPHCREEFRIKACPCCGSTVGEER